MRKRTGSKRRARAAQKLRSAIDPRAPALVEQQARDQESRQHEEHVDPEEATRGDTQPAVEQHHQRDGERTHAVERGDRAGKACRRPIGLVDADVGDFTVGRFASGRLSWGRTTPALSSAFIVPDHVPRPRTVHRGGARGSDPGPGGRRASGLPLHLQSQRLVVLRRRHHGARRHDARRGRASSAWCVCGRAWRFSSSPGIASCAARRAHRSRPGPWPASSVRGSCPSCCAPRCSAATCMPMSPRATC